MPDPTSRSQFERTLQAAVARVLLSRRNDSPQAIRLHSFFIAANTAALVIGLMFACFTVGTLSRDSFIQVTAAVLAAVIGFYIVFRTGLNRAAADSSLTLPQTVVASLIVLYAAYSAGPAGAGVFPIVLVMIFLFGVLRLRTKALVRLALFILAGDAFAIALRWHFQPQPSDLHVQLLQWVTLAVTLPWFALMGGYISGLREQLSKSNALQQNQLQAIRVSESRLSEAQRIAGLGSWTFDPARKVVYWSPETYRIFGMDPVQPIPVGAKFLQIVHPDDRQHYRELLAPARDEGRRFDSQYRIVLSGGEIRWLHVVGEPVVDEAGRTTLLRGTVTDITARKAHEAALVQARDGAATAQATLIDAIEGLPEAFALFDADDHLVLSNARYARMFTDFERFDDIAGMSFEDLVRGSLAKGEVIPPEFANDVEGWVADRVWHHRHPLPETRELELGGERWLQVTERRTSAGGIVGVRSDITERKQITQRQAMEHAVTRLMADSKTISETMPQVIQTICETLGWDCGARWHEDQQDHMLRCLESWSIAAREVSEFCEFSRRQCFPQTSGGLLRRVWATGRPVWIADVSREPGFLRAPAAARAGLHGAFAFPIRIGPELVGVVEFFIRNVRQPDPALLRVLDSIGLQIGQLIARKSAEEQLKQMAHYDFLTGLPNRSLFNELLARAFAKAERHRTHVAVLFVDLDGFKRINDTFGHDAGDHLLATFTQRLRKCLRKSDTLGRRRGPATAARLGGDEFVVMVDDVADPSEVTAVAQRIGAAAAAPFDVAGAVGRVTASIGIALYPQDGRDVDELIKAADSAMYEAKQSGKNIFQFFRGGRNSRQVSGRSARHVVRICPGGGKA